MSRALIVSTLMISGCVTNAPSANKADEVRVTEAAFAKTMADRDFSAFQRFLSKDAVFFGDHSIAHGAGEVSVVWKPSRLVRASVLVM